MKKNIIKRVLVTSAIVASLGFCTSVPTLNFNGIRTAYAASENIFVNGNFSNSSNGNTHPFTPNNFTRVNNNTNVKGGIIYVDETNFDKYKQDYGFDLSENNTTYLHPANKDNQVLLLNNTTENEYSSGFKSDAFTLGANKFYLLSLYARSVNGGRGSIILQGNKNETAKALYSTKQVLTDGWEQYNFLIETNKNISTSATLNLWLGDNETSGSRGGVMFDTISLTEIDETTYLGASRENNNNYPNSQIISLASSENLVENLIENANFEDTISTSEGVWNGWTRSKDGNFSKAEIHNLQYSIDDGIIPKDYKASSQNSYGLALYSKDSGYATVTSNEFLVKQNDRLEIRFYAKLGEDTNATARLYATSVEKNGITLPNETANFEGIINIVSTTNENTNDYGLYKFVVNGNYNFDTNVKIELNLGSSESKTKGYVVFDDFSVYRLNNALINAAGDENKTIVNLYSGSVSNPTVANGRFNFANSIEFENDFGDVIYPIANVTSFEKTTSDENISVAGIIDVNQEHFNNHISEYGTSVNPLSPSLINNVVSKTSTNNILMLRNKSEGYTTFTSTDTKTLAKNSYAKISVEAYRETAGNTGNAYFKVLDDNNNEIAKVSINEDFWQTKTIYISSGLVDSTTLKFALCLGEQNNYATGNAYFDMLEYETIDENEFNSAQKKADRNTAVVDISKLTFGSSSELVAGHNNVYVSTEFNLNDVLNADDTILGVLKNTNEHSSSGLTNTLWLSNTHEGISSATSTRGFSVETGSFYKISVYAKIADIETAAQLENNEFGAFIGLSNYSSNESRHVNLKDTYNTYGDRAFKKFEFVISPETSETLNIVIGLGSKTDDVETKVAGSIFIDNITIESITASEFDNYDTGKLANNVVGVKVGKHDVESSENNSLNTRNRFQFNWWYFSSIVLALAIIVVIITLLIKKVDWKKVKAKFGKKDGSNLADYDTRRIEHEQEVLAKKELRARKRAAKKQNKNK